MESIWLFPRHVIPASQIKVRPVGRACFYLSWDRSTPIRMTCVSTLRDKAESTIPLPASLHFKVLFVFTHCILISFLLV